MITSDLPPEIEMRLERLEKATGRSKSSFLQEAIVEYLGDREDLQLAEQELNDLEEGRSSTKPLSEVMKQYGLGN